MATLTTDDVRRIAKLARLAIDEKAVPRYVHDLTNILSFADQMSKANTQQISAMAHPLEVMQRLRPDEITEKNQRELCQSIAPSVEAGLYLVPQFVE